MGQLFSQKINLLFKNPRIAKKALVFFISFFGLNAHSGYEDSCSIEKTRVILKKTWRQVSSSVRRRNVSTMERRRRRNVLTVGTFCHIFWHTRLEKKNSLHSPGGIEPMILGIWAWHLNHYTTTFNLTLPPYNSPMIIGPRRWYILDMLPTLSETIFVSSKLLAVGNCIDTYLIPWICFYLIKCFPWI